MHVGQSTSPLLAGLTTVVQEQELACWKVLLHLEGRVHIAGPGVMHVVHDHSQGSHRTLCTAVLALGAIPAVHILL